MMASAETERGWAVVSEGGLRGFVERCMVSLGVDASQAADLSQLIYSADYRGHYSHGLNRLDMYVSDIKTGSAAKCATPVVVKENAATAHVDGRNALGPTVGKFCMDLAIKKAKTAGIGWVVANGSNHFGIAGWYGMEACKHGLLGMAFTTTSPCVYATRSKQKTLGTNPISLAAPVNREPAFVLDMATSTVSYGKLEIAERKGETIPLSWGSDADGKESSDPSLVMREGGLLPLGGSEISGGYKGYGLALLVDILTSGLSGGEVSPCTRVWSSKPPPQIANLGQCFIAIDPDSFAPGFGDRLENLLDTCRGRERIDESVPVLVPGDPEANHMKKCDDLGGISYHPNQIEFAERLAKELGVEGLKTL